MILYDVAIGPDDSLANYMWSEFPVLLLAVLVTVIIVVSYLIIKASRKRKVKLEPEDSDIESKEDKEE